MVIKFLKNEPAAVIGKKLLIADLHLGVERELRQAGYNIKNQTKKLIKKTKNLAEQNNCSKIIILGDLKHSITLEKDVQDAKTYCKKLSDQFEVILIQGNHDGKLDEILDIKVYDSKGLEAGKYYLIHGHAVPPKKAFKKTIIMSHIHPIVEIKDKLGLVFQEKVWLKGKNIIVMPHFNHLIGGKDIRVTDLGALTKYFDKKELDIYLLDGLYLSKVKELGEKDETSNSG